MMLIDGTMPLALRPMIEFFRVFHQMHDGEDGGGPAIAFGLYGDRGFGGMDYEAE